MPEDAERVDWSTVLAWRMRRQQLAERAPRAALLDVVARIAGLHAQLLSSAELTAWARVEGLEPGDVERALWEERSLVKTWAMRGTLHLLPSSELGLWVGVQGALEPRHHSGAWLRSFELTREEAEAILDAIPRALRGAQLTRDELAAAVGAATGSPRLGDKLRESWGALLKPSAFRGDLVFAPGAGRHVRFTHPGRWLGDLAPVAVAEAVPEVVRRYLAAYGPATREELARWLGTPSAARAGKLIRTLGDELAAVEVDGVRRWLLAADAVELQAARPDGAVRLLPAFDQYVVAAPRDVEAVLASQHRPRVYRPQGWLSPVLLVDGRMAGVWRLERRSGAVRVTIEPFAPVPPGVRDAAGAEAERLAAFLGAPLALEWARAVPA